MFPSTGIIKLKNNGDFLIANEGRRPIYIDGRPVLTGNKWKLNNNSVVEVHAGKFFSKLGLELTTLPTVFVSTDRRPQICVSDKPGTHLLNKG